MHNPFLRRVTHQSMFLVCLCGGAAAADVPPASMPAPVPRIERVVPLEQDPAVQGSFFREDFANLPALKGRFFDVAEGPGKFCISEADAFDGKKGLDQSYINRHTYDARDKGSAGWISRFFGDSPLVASRIENASPEALHRHRAPHHRAGHTPRMDPQVGDPVLVQQPGEHRALDTHGDGGDLGRQAAQRPRPGLGGAWSAWSGWHAGFATAWKRGAQSGERTHPRGYLAR